MKDKKPEETANFKGRPDDDRKQASKLKKTIAQKPNDPAADEGPLDPKMGRHGVDEETQLNPEE